jgi:hypothetical protein
VGILHAGYRAGLCSAVLFLLSAAGLKADSICYEFSSTWGVFGTVDLTTGAVSSLASYRYFEASLGVYDGSLYTATTAELYTVSTATGSIAPVDNDFGVHLADLGSTLSGLYGVGWGTGDGSSSSDLGVYSIDPSTGLAALVGLTGLGYNAGDYIGLSTNSSTLYFGDNNDLYTIATTTGAVTLVGSFGAGALPYEMGAMTTINGVLYGADVNNGMIDTINTSNGTAAPGAASKEIFGLAPDPLPSGGLAAPEPGSWSLLAAALGVLMVAKRKMKNRRTSSAPPAGSPPTVRSK